MFNGVQQQIPKNPDSQVIKVLKKEKIQLKDCTVMGIIECHEQHIRDVDEKGNVHIIKTNVNYIRCSTCQVAIQGRPNFVAHKCSKRLRRDVLNLCCHKGCSKTFNSD